LGKYRHKLQIIADILSIVGKGARRTHVMFQANLSYRLLCRYLYIVTGAGLVNCENEDCYKLTPRGKEFLDRFDEYSKSWKHLEEQVNKVNHERLALENMCSTNLNSAEMNLDGRRKEREQESVLVYNVQKTKL